MCCVYFALDIIPICPKCGSGRGRRNEKFQKFCGRHLRMAAPNITINLFLSDARFVVPAIMVWEELKVWYDDGIHGVGNEIIVAATVITALVLVGYKLLSWAMPGNAAPNAANRDHIGIPGA